MPLKRYEARLVAGDPWTAEVAVPGARWPDRCRIEREGDSILQREGPPSAAPPLRDIDRALGRAGYVRAAGALTGEPVDGAGFEVIDFRSGGADPDGAAAEQAATELALARGASAVVMTLPAAEVPRLRAALAEALPAVRGDAMAAYVRYVDRRLDAATTDVRMTAWVHELLLMALTDAIPPRAGDATETDTAAEVRRLIEHAQQARFTTGPWPAPREALQAALRQALAQPGAEGLAARDELLDVVGRFVAAHRTATRADDAEQQRLQAERDGHA
ncbi:hypothetical protein H9Y04_09700 [Streptomyces sp. TRM66268-LWL]|uniref:Uncharacterized protein n=1 Tax=Streptomyces polyasparticus TaxID=2767826 RepID=A0ABR7SBJ6_9ACTN|nr:hypothetical protein [Streptomyces polyasparticus]MBC9712846.1 hypothetical protein [Streptomyces polyasparticus]